MKKNLLTKIFKFTSIFATVLFCNIAAFAVPYFSGSAGGGIQLKGKGQQDPPDFMVDAYFSGQFDLSQHFILRTAGSVYTTESLFSDGTFNDANAKLSLDELSITYRGFMGAVTHYLGVYLGDYDTIGSDIFLRRQFGLPEFQSKLTESICGVNKARIFDMSGIGGTYYVSFPANVAIGFYVYYNKKDLTSYTFGTPVAQDATKNFTESLNVDFRVGGAWSQFAFDFALGVNMPFENSYINKDSEEEKVVVLIRRADIHAGLTAFFGSTNSSSLLFQAGFTKLVLDPVTLAAEPALTLDNCYIFIEPRFVTKGLIFSFALFNMPEKSVAELFYIHHPVGINVNFASPWFLAGSRKSQFGVMGTVSFTKTMDVLIKNSSDLVKYLEVSVCPYGVINFGAGKLNFAINIDCMTINSWDTFLKNFSLVVGYKVVF